MTKHRAAIALSLTALAVAVLGQTAVGHAAANAVRVALFAKNSAHVNNISASRTPAAGRLLALDANGKFPASVLPAAAKGAPGATGPQGPAGPAGPKGDAGPAGTSGYTHTIIVHPDRDAGKGGSELLRALEGITDNSAANPYFVKIEPGIYDVGSRSLVMKEYVDVEGSGESVTTIASHNTSGAGTVTGADHSELRFATVKNIGGGQQSVAVFSESTSPRFTHVTAISSGSSENYGFHISNGSALLTSVTALASGGASSFGLANFGGNTTGLNSTFSAADASGFDAGVLTTFGGSTKLTSSTLSASGGVVAIGMRAYSGSHTLANVVVSGSGAGQSYGLWVGQKTSTPTVIATQSRIAGATSIFVLGGSIKIGASQLTGPSAFESPGTLICAGAYDGAFQPLGAACT